ncbi:adenosine deaminase [Luedemannella flava]|uniref:Adenosine deaminase n=1 Tax=Luedemannella flava TaxID=349316 RepID=A0ABN2LHB5_9ACTN
MVPAIELHVHLEGAIRPHTLLEIARNNGETLPASSVAELEALYEFTDFAHFIDVWMLTTNCLRTADDFRRIVVDYAAEAASFGAVYVEGIFSPGERVQRGLRFEDIFEGYAEGAREAESRHGVTVRFTPDIHRQLPVDLAEECARQAVRYRDHFVVGFGLGGNEYAAPLEPYRKALEIARDGGLGLVPHAGELPGRDGLGGALSVREALDVGADRIRHGIWAVEDPDVVAELVDRGVVLDVCPTSNLRTRSVPALSEHPLPALLAAGVACTVNTDDPAMFGTDLGRELAAAASLGLSGVDAFRAGVAGALCDAQTRARLASLAL